MFEKFTEKFNYFKPGKLFSSAKEAFKKARADKDKGTLEKIGIFFSSFFEEMQKVDAEKTETTKATSAEVKKGVDETMADARKAVELKGDVSDEDKNFHDEVLAMAVTSFEGMDEGHQQSAHDAMVKIDNKANGKEATTFTFEEAGSLVAVGFKTLKQLKERFKTKEEFKAALDRIVKISDSSSYPFKKLLSADTLKLFAITDEAEGLKFLEAFGVEPSAGDIASKALSLVGAGSEVKGDALKVKELMKGLAQSPIQNKDGIVDFMKQRIFPNTERDSIVKVVEILNEMITGSSDKINTEQLANLAFYIHGEDYDHLITALVGKQNSAVVELAKAA